MELTGYPTSDLVDHKVMSYESIMNRKDIQPINKNVTEAFRPGGPSLTQNTGYNIKR
jgi:hypothetical protein